MINNNLYTINNNLYTINNNLYTINNYFMNDNKRFNLFLNLNIFLLMYVIMTKEIFNNWNMFVSKFSNLDFNTNTLIHNKKSIFEIFGYLYILQISYKFIFYSSGNLRKIMWNNIKKIPLVNTKINDKVKEIIDNINLGFQNELTDLKFYKEIPIQGLKKK